MFLVNSFNPYTGEESIYILAKDLVGAHFNPKGEELAFEEYKHGDKVIPYRILNGLTFKGTDLCGDELQATYSVDQSGRGCIQGN